MNIKPCVVILSGEGAPAIAAANIYYRKLSDRYRILVIEEKSLTLEKVFNLLKRRWHNYGIFSVADFLLLRILFLFKGGASLNREYRVILRCKNINNEQVSAFIEAENPDWIITNACSILSQTLLSTIKAPILNVHNGIAPRYRGAGNCWAVREDNPSLIGVTVHRVDKGIDTGARIAMASMAVEDPRCLTLSGMDIAAFEDGAVLACKFILYGDASIPRIFSELNSCYYSYPGLSDWLVARRHLKRWRGQPSNSDKVWSDSFNELATNHSLDKYQRMHWDQSATVAKRDAFILRQVKKVINPRASILDIGGGDGRLALHLTPFNLYVNADYTLTFLKEMKRDPGQGAFAIQCDALSLPFASRTFNLIMAIGLLQHISEAQRVVDSLLLVKAKDGAIVINTLRQFSLLELLLIIGGSILSSNRRSLAYSILKRDYYSGRKVGGVLVARRYKKSELIRMFRLGAPVTVHYNGLLGTAFLAREITLVFQ